jgi:ABC-type transport system involved in multi-copper enzyme maturation permease subunit
MQMHGHPNAAMKGVATYTQVEIFEKLAILWATLSVMLGTGGLLRERRLGTASFLLSLPISRVRLLGVRCAVSVLETSGLALAAYAMVPLAFPLVHQDYSWGLALRYALILAASGISFAAFGILISLVLEGGAWPAIIGASTAFLSLVLGEIVASFSKYAPFSVLSGESYFRYGVVPWAGMSISLVAASLMLASALLIVKWRDF